MRKKKKKKKKKNDENLFNIILINLKNITLLFRIKLKKFLNSFLFIT